MKYINRNFQSFQHKECQKETKDKSVTSKVQKGKTKDKEPKNKALQNNSQSTNGD